MSAGTTAQRDYAAAWERGQSKRAYVSQWVIVTLQRYLPREHVALAHRLADAYAMAALLSMGADERIDAACNRAEIAMGVSVDARRQLRMYEAAVRGKLGWRGVRAMHAIAASASLADLMHAAGYRRGSSRSARELVQKVMLIVAAAEETDHG